MAGYHIYEEYLDRLDTKLLIEDAHIQSLIVNDFSVDYEVPLSKCSTLEDIKKEAVNYSIHLLNVHENTEYLVKRFVTLASEFNNIQYNFDSFLSRITISRISKEANITFSIDDEGKENKLFLSIKGKYNPYVCFERDLSKKQVKVITPLVGYPEIKTSLIDKAEVFYSKNFILICIDPAKDWETTCGDTESVFVKPQLIGYFKFAIDKEIFGPNRNLIRDGLNKVFADLQVVSHYLD